MWVELRSGGEKGMELGRPLRADAVWRTRSGKALVQPVVADKCVRGR